MREKAPLLATAALAAFLHGCTTADEARREDISDLATPSREPLFPMPKPKPPLEAHHRIRAVSVTPEQSACNEANYDVVIKNGKPFKVHYDCFPTHSGNAHKKK